MDNTDFLAEYGIELLVEKSELNNFNAMIAEAQQSYVISTKELGEYRDGAKVFKITCLRKNFAMAYWHIGILWHKYNFVNKNKK